MAATVHIDANRTWGGGQAQSLGLATALAAGGERTHFIVQVGSALAARLEGTDLPWEGASLRGLSGALAVGRLSRRLGELAPQVVHVHDSASHAMAGVATRRAGSARIVVTRRTEFPVRGSWLGRLKYDRWCDRLICISEAVRRRCLEGGVPADRMVVIPDFVDCAHFDPAVMGSVERNESPTIAMVGRLTHSKGHGVLLRAMKGVLRAVPNARLVISGEGEEEASLRREAELQGVAGHVEFAGFVPDVRAVLGAADVFVMPSLEEGLGVAVLEAMAMAKPVVVSNAGGLPEAVAQGETGLICAAGDAEALAEALVSLLTDPERARKMGEAGRARARREFDKPRVVERVSALYESVLAGGQ